MAHVLGHSKKYSEPPASEITPKHLYYSRRTFMKLFGAAGAAAFLAACGAAPTPTGNPTSKPTAVKGMPAPTDSGLKDELGDPANTFDDITHFNNYYEFSMSKSEVANLVENFKTSPWQVEVSGLVEKPSTFAIEDILNQFPQEERIYRLRCVEGWSMVIPWTGFPLAALLKAAQPTGSAKYVRFVSANNPDQMPGVSFNMFPWPYQEGLRLDEAMNDLAFLVTGLYGKPLPAQDGAPIRLVVPWKYGFKGAKSLIKIELVEKQPATFWSTTAPEEYGFYANVNPDVPHPRWSQSSERRIGELGRRKTLLFNGYAEQVGQLYTGMDLKVNY
ncbi:MAG TPA: protein-methionine-sulfoxide reductase catalytic subunit MsrP [Anaerolineaceae bacterium]|nr:protein-methionine-sulfoxide reductase catalytic subunit MsrP [Anaerolineaceae bacterium]